MSNVRSLHEKAISLAQQSLDLRRDGKLEAAISLAAEAFELEAQAVNEIAADISSEPTRSILCQSAASLAFQSDNLHEARRYVGLGLAGYPPEEIAAELLSLLEDISSASVLGIESIGPEQELELVFQGPAVGFGTVPVKDLIERIQAATTLLSRTTQRLFGRPYSRGGEAPKEQQPFVPLVRAPEPGSFKVGICLGIPHGQTAPLLVTPQHVINEVAEAVALLEAAHEHELRVRIADPAYYVNFVATARRMSPDGERIDKVVVRTRHLTIPLVRPRSSIDLPQHLESKPEEPSEPEEVVIEGVLDFATSRRHESEIGLTTDQNQEYDINVAEGLDDLVRSFYGDRVKVSGTLEIHHGKRILELTNIEDADD